MIPGVHATADECEAPHVPDVPVPKCTFPPCVCDPSETQDTDIMRKTDEAMGWAARACCDRFKNCAATDKSPTGMYDQCLIEHCNMAWMGKESASQCLQSVIDAILMEGTCTSVGTFGEDCDKTCDPDASCSSHGKCSPQGGCVCDEDWEEEEDCSVERRVCDVSGRGTQGVIASEQYGVFAETYACGTARCIRSVSVYSTAAMKKVEMNVDGTFVQADACVGTGAATCGFCPATCQEQDKPPQFRWRLELGKQGETLFSIDKVDPFPGWECTRAPPVVPPTPSCDAAGVVTRVALCCERYKGCDTDGKEGGDCTRCADGYFGKGCAVYCDAAKTCSGHGSCNGDGACVCDDEWADLDEAGRAAGAVRRCAIEKACTTAAQAGTGGEWTTLSTKYDSMSPNDSSLRTCARTDGRAKNKEGSMAVGEASPQPSLAACTTHHGVAACAAGRCVQIDWWPAPAQCALFHLSAT
eukprot:gene17112-26075_t